MCLSDEVIKKVCPPRQIESFVQLERMLADPDCITLCLESSFLHIKSMLLEIFRKRIQGDVVLVGVWRGGLAMYIQSLLVEHQQTSRGLVLADTFKGFLPVADEFIRDRKMYDYFSTLKAPSGSVREIKDRFKAWGLPEKNVHFYVGDICLTADDIQAPVSALLIDVDFYEPTFNALSKIYKKVSSGGGIYIDDYGADEYECRQAVDHFIASRNEKVDPYKINKFAVSWIKE